MELTHLDLFSGIGGFSLAAKQAGFRTIGFVEIDKYCQKVLRKHWPDVPMMEDIRDVKEDTFQRPIDLITGGFPCQDLSIAGRRAGLAGERSGLFFEMRRVIGEIKPRWVLVENVAGLLTSNRGADFAIVLNALDKLGYCVAWRVLDSQWCGVPQRRRRVFIVGSLGDKSAAEVLDKTNGKLLEEMEGGMVSPVLTAAGNTDASGGSGNNCIIGTLKAAGVDTMSGVGYVGTYRDKGIDAERMRAIDGISRWLDGAINDQVRDNGKDKVEGDKAGEGIEKASLGFGLEGVQEELGEAINRRCLYKFEVGDIPRRLFLAWMPSALKTAQDKPFVLGGEDRSEQTEGQESNQSMGGKGLDSDEVLDAPTFEGRSRKDKGGSNEAERYKALGNAIVPQCAYAILKEMVELDYANI
jgi:DNA (cytosine-5)-methyltransferase 1